MVHGLGDGVDINEAALVNPATDVTVGIAEVIRTISNEPRDSMRPPKVEIEYDPW